MVKETYDLMKKINNNLRLAPSGEVIFERCLRLAENLIAKNISYGDSALNPNPISKPKHILKALKSSKLSGVKLEAFYILDSPFLFSESEIIKPSGFGIEEISNSGGRFAFELE